MIQEQIQRLRESVTTCYNTVSSKNGVIPEEVGDFTVRNLPEAIESIPTSNCVLTSLEVTADGEYLPDDYNAAGFSKVTARFDTSGLSKVKMSSFKVTNDCINDDGIWEGESFIDTSECQSFQYAFSDCTKLTKINTRGWCTNKVITLNLMFHLCNSLSELDLRDWDTSNVTNAYYFAYQNGYIHYTALDFTSWDLGNLTNPYMLAGITKVQTLVGGRTLEDVVENNITIFKNLKISLLYLNAMTDVDTASLRALINGLADVTDQPVDSRPTLTLDAAVMAKLETEDPDSITIATEKGWSLS